MFSRIASYSQKWEKSSPRKGPLEAKALIVLLSPGGTVIMDEHRGRGIGNKTVINRNISKKIDNKNSIKTKKGYHSLEFIISWSPKE